MALTLSAGFFPPGTAVSLYSRRGALEQPWAFETVTGSRSPRRTRKAPDATALASGTVTSSGGRNVVALSAWPEAGPAVMVGQVGGVWRRMAVTVPAETNLLVNPSAQGGVYGWSPDDPVASEAFVIPNLESFRVETVDGMEAFVLERDEGAVDNASLQAFDTVGFAVTGGSRISWGGWFRSSAGSKNATCAVTYLNAAGGIVSGDSGGPSLVVTSSWQRAVRENRFVPVSAVRARLAFAVDDGSPGSFSGERYYVNRLMVVAGSTLPTYGDGDSEWYEWAGERGRSVSVPRA